MRVNNDRIYNFGLLFADSLSLMPTLIEKKFTLSIFLNKITLNALSLQIFSLNTD